ncbi:MAG: hypothetical protein CMK59_08890 [Proteobacteria bacterium]|nr:hypothetical protein [Pseudomonadota bacterium]
MLTSILITFIVLGLLGWIMSMPNRLQRLTTESIKTNDLDKLINELKRHPEELRMRSFDKVLSQMWEAQAYSLCAQCLQHLFEDNAFAPKGHRWIKRILEEQPQIGHNLLSPDLIDQYQPALAAQCDAGG